jgi:DNA polymerase III subunit delta
MAHPGFSFHICPDSGLLQRRIDDDLSQQGPGWEKRVFWADEILPPGFWESLSLPGLMGGSRAVVLRRADSLGVDEWAKFVPVLGRYQQRIWPILCLEGEWKGARPAVPAALSKQKFWTVAGKKGWVWSSPGLSRKECSGIISEWTRRNGLTLAPNLQELMLGVMPMEMAALGNELEKVLLVLAGRTTVTAEDLAVVSFTSEMQIFAFLDAVLRSKEAARVWEQVLTSQVGSDNSMIFPFIALLLREARILWQLGTGDAAEVRLPSHAMSDKLELARRIGSRKLSRVWHMAFEAELGIKSGRFSPDQAMELLVSGLMLLFRPAKD